MPVTKKVTRCPASRAAGQRLQLAEIGAGAGEEEKVAGHAHVEECIQIAHTTISRSMKTSARPFNPWKCRS
jgi:hypothetical protein